MKKHAGAPPYQRPDREYESNLGLYRIDRGLTIKDLCTLAMVHPTAYANLNNGMESPLYECGERAGRPKVAAKRLCEALGIDIEDAFPRYFCKIAGPAVLSRLQIVNITIGDYSQILASGTPPLDIAPNDEDFWIAVKKLLPNRRRYMALSMYYRDGLTYRQIAKIINRSTERARRLIVDGIRKIQAALRKFGHIGGLSDAEKIIAAAASQK